METWLKIIRVRYFTRKLVTVLLIEHMENKYRELLRKAKQKAPANIAFFPSEWSYTEEADYVLETPVPKDITLNTADEVSTPTEVTEKTKVLDSLNVFGDDKLKNLEEYNFQGGQILPKPQPEVSSKLNATNLNLTEIQKQYQALLKPEYYTAKFPPGFEKAAEGIKVLFLTDDLVESVEDGAEAFKELSAYFDINVSQLFGRMIHAMQLDEGQYYLSSYKVNDNSIESLCFSEILHFRPELIITLGAQATNGLLASKERLKDIHGQINQIQIKDETGQEQTFNLMPLFSPKLLQTAPNMKKTAWADMQKAMEFLNL